MAREYYIAQHQVVTFLGEAINRVCRKASYAPYAAAVGVDEIVEQTTPENR